MSSVRSHGFTLIEILIYIALVAFILLAATGFALEFVASNAKATAIQEVNRNARFALARVALEVREAKDICISSDPEPPPRSVFHATAAKLVLLKPGVSTSCATAADLIVIDREASDRLQFSKDGTVLPLTSTRVKITEFGLENLAVGTFADVVRIHLKVDYAPPTDSTLPTEYTASTTVETTAIVQRGEGVAP